jgi:light-regulated signal transduction histidine kinase (bacteriophytochrome)
MILAGWVVAGIFAALAGALAAWGVNKARTARDEERRAQALDERLREASAKLDAASRELESLSYTVAHDLRAPLRAIDGFSRIFDERYGRYVDDEGRRLLGLVRDSARRLGTLLDSLLALSRLGRQALYPVDVDMRALAAEAWVELAGDSGVSCSLEELPPAYGDRQLLKQVWTNLLSNAVKYTSRREGPLIQVTGSQSGEENVYCVSDNGAGFDMKHAARLFGVFQRLHAEAEFPGTGIGLATVARIIARHGGRVWAEGVTDAGARFYFSLPGGKT